MTRQSCQCVIDGGLERWAHTKPSFWPSWILFLLLVWARLTTLSWLIVWFAVPLGFPSLSLIHLYGLTLIGTALTVRVRWCTTGTTTMGDYYIQFLGVGLLLGAGWLMSGAI